MGSLWGAGPPNPATATAAGGGLWGDNNANAAGPAPAPGRKKKKGPSLWGQVTALPGGIVRGAAHTIANLPTEVNALQGVVTGHHFMGMPARQEGESDRDYSARVSPLVAGTGLGLEHLVSDIRHPTHITRSGESLGRTIGDLGAAAIVAGPLVRGLSAGAAAAEAGAEGAGTAARVGGLAGRLGLGPVDSVLPGGAALSPEALQALHTAAAIPEHAAGAPFLPVRALVDVAGKGLPAFADSALGQERSPQGVAGRVGDFLGSKASPREGGTLERFLQGRDSTAREVGTAVRETSLRKEAVRGQQAKLGRGVVDIIDGNEPAAPRSKFFRGVQPAKGDSPAVLAFRESQQGTGDALAAIRASDPAGFPKFVEDHYKGALPVESANLIADVAEGKNADMASRFAEADQFERNAPGGKGEQAAGYVRRNPAGAAQLGHDPLGLSEPGSVQDAPARLRPALELNRLANDQHGAALPSTLEDLQAAGMDPAHQYHVFGQQPAGSARSMSPLRAGAKTGERFERTGSEGWDRSQQAQAGEAVRRETAGLQQDLARKVAATAGREAGPGTVEVDLGKGVGKIHLPRGLVDRFSNSIGPQRGAAGFGRTLDFANRVYKDIHFAADPATVAQRSISVAVMTLLHADNPVAWGRGLISAFKWRAEHGEWFGGEAVGHGGPAQLETLGKEGTASASRLVRGLKALEDKARTVPKVASFADSWVQSGYVLSKIGDGFTEEEAVAAGLRAFGDYQTLSAAEKNFVQRAIPFWTFVREVTKTTAYLAEDHPYRVAVMTWLAANHPDRRGLFGSAEGGLDAGPNTLGLNGLLADFATPSQFLQSPANLAAGFASPPLKLLLQSATGTDASTLAPYKRPAGFGRAAPSLAEQVGKWTPATKLIRDLSGHNDIARYKSDQPVVAQHKTIATPRSTSQALLSFLGIPTDNTNRLTSDAAESAQRAAAADKRNEASRKRYQRDVARSRK